MYVKRMSHIVPTPSEIKLFDRGTQPITRNNGWDEAFPFLIQDNGDREWLVEDRYGEFILVDTKRYPNLLRTDAIPLIYLVVNSMDILQLETDWELEIFHVQEKADLVLKIFEAICEYCMRIHKV